MNRGEKNILFIAGHRFDYHPGGTYHLARQFVSNGYRVGYVSYFISPFHWLGSRNKAEFRERVRVWRKGGDRLENGRIWSYVPFSLFPIFKKPLLRSRWVAANSHKLTVPSLMKMLEKNGFASVDILWLDSTLYGFALDAVAHRRSVLRLFDDGVFQPNAPRSFREIDTQVVESVDVVISLSHYLIEKYKSVTDRKIDYQASAVDVNFFDREPANPPEEYRTIPRPRVVCLGGINSPHLFDVRLILHAVRSLPGVSFVFLGEPTSDISELSGLPNVHILGRRPYAEVSRYLKNADVGIVPYGLNPRTDRLGADLLKPYEYMACGLPVVSLKFREFDSVSLPIRLARNYDEFVEQIRGALEETDRSRYLEFARANSWERRFEEVMGFLDRRAPREKPISG